MGRGANGTSRIMRRAGFAAWIAMALALATPLAAQEWGYEEKGGRIYATSCGDALSGEIGLLCLTVGCDEGAEMDFSLNASLPLPASAEVSFTIDGGGGLARAFVTRDQRGESLLSYRVRFDEDTALLDALQTGGTLEIAMGLSGEEIRHRFSLSGSRVALAPVIEACPLLPGPIDDPETTERRVIEMACAALQGETTFSGGFAERADYDGDGLEDILIDRGGSSCTTARDLYCDEASCDHVLYRAGGAGFTVALEARVRSVIDEPGPGVTLEESGAACGREADFPCATRMTLTDAEPLFETRLHGTLAADWIAELTDSQPR